MTRDINKSLRSYAWALLAGHFFALAYLVHTRLLFRLLVGSEPLCWPYLPSCGEYRFDSTHSIIIVAILHASLIAAAATALSKNTFWGLIAIGVLNVWLFGLVSLDYRFRANEFYMLFWLNAVVLLWPSKRWAIPLLLISFYFWAGRLKLNEDWLSGGVLYHPLWLIPERFTKASCVYVVVLEMIMIWGLLSRRRSLRLAVLIQLALFHIESLSQIHWFYPALMASMLAWFLIDEYTFSPEDRPTLEALIRGRAPAGAYLLLLLFAGFQLVPLMYRGDPALTGQGRLLALHMFEARQECTVSAVLHYSDRGSVIHDLKLSTLPIRIVCDPIVYYSRARNLCSSRTIDQNLKDVDFLMISKRSVDREYTTIIDEAHFCDPPRRYSLLSRDTWVK